MPNSDETRHDLPSRRTMLLSGLSLLALTTVAAGPAMAQSWRDRLRGIFGGDGGSLTESEATQGLKEALRVGAERVIGQVGAVDGYLGDPQIRIPLPGWLGQARRVLSFTGGGALFNDLETRLNRAAELAAPKAKPIFVDAISAMTVQDAIGIVQGPQNSATLYFQEKMTPRLKQEFRPVIDTQLNEAGAIQSMNAITSRYSSNPLVGNITDGAVGRLVDHGLEGALSGMFYYLGKEEAAIRENPAARTTEILKRVFK